MRKSILTLSLCLLVAVTMTAQEEAAPEGPWKFDGSVGLNAAATGLVNWAAGGKNNVNGFVYGKLHLLYSKDAFAWETNFDTDFGLTWIDQDEDAFHFCMQEQAQCTHIIQCRERITAEPLVHRLGCFKSHEISHLSD